MAIAVNLMPSAAPNAGAARAAPGAADPHAPAPGLGFAAALDQELGSVPNPADAAAGPEATTAAPATDADGDGKTLPLAAPALATPGLAAPVLAVPDPAAGAAAIDAAPGTSSAIPALLAGPDAGAAETGGGFGVARGTWSRWLAMTAGAQPDQPPAVPARDGQSSYNAGTLPAPAAMSTRDAANGLSADLAAGTVATDPALSGRSTSDTLLAALRHQALATSTVTGVAADGTVGFAVPYGQAPLAPALTPPSATPLPHVQVPVGQPGWGEAFSNQVAWLTGQQVQGAELRLSPPELGPLAVRISIDRDQASIAFTSQHLAVRDAIEAALPRLREMLHGQGVTLVDVNVSQHAFSQARQDAHGGASSAFAFTARPGASAADPASAGVRLSVTTGLIDFYA